MIVCRAFLTVAALAEDLKKHFKEKQLSLVGRIDKIEHDPSIRAARIERGSPVAVARNPWIAFN